MPFSLTIELTVVPYLREIPQRVSPLLTVTLISLHPTVGCFAGVPDIADESETRIPSVKRSRSVLPVEIPLTVPPSVYCQPTQPLQRSVYDG